MANLTRNPPRPLYCAMTLTALAHERRPQTSALAEHSINMVACSQKTY